MTSDRPLAAVRSWPGMQLASQTGRRPLWCSLPTVTALAPGMTSGPQLALLWVFCRIEHQLATPGVAALARREHIYLDQRFSDHAPLTIDYDFKL